MTLHDIQTLVGFNYWAKKRLIESIAEMTPDLFLNNITSSHGSVRGTLAHLAGAEGVWLKRLRGQDVAGLPKPEEFPDLASLITFWDGVEHDIQTLVDTFTTDHDITRQSVYRDLRGNTHSQPVWQILHHMVNHSTYHRGQITILLRQLGLKPIGTDLIQYYRETTPAG
jgi:uncharacterized damage-inducible protein DinB